jgi:large subunit ribosomal protein L24
MQKRENQSNRFQPKLHVKRGDKVMVIAGSNKGKVGVIKEVFPDKNVALLEGLNMVKKHVKPTQNSQGGIVEVEAPIHLSNLMIVDPKSSVPTRVKRTEVDGKSTRVSVKSGEIIK